MIVLQMGSQMKRTIFDEQTAKALKKWHKAVVKKQQQQQQKESSHDPSKTPTTDTTEASRLSQCQFVEAVPVHQHLRRYKTIAHVGATRPLSDSECSDTDADTQTRYLIPPTKQRSLDAEVRVDVDDATPDHHDSFSFQRLPHSQNVPEK
jgi:mlo protein